MHWRRIRPKNQRSHRRRKGRTSFGPQLVKRVAKLLFQALPGGRASVLCEIAGLFAGGSAVFEATSPIMTVFYCFPAATGTLRGLLPRKIFCQAAGRGVSPPPAAAPQIFNLSRGSFAFGKTAESAGFCVRMLTKSTDCQNDEKARKSRKQTCRQGNLPEHK